MSPEKLIKKTFDADAYLHTDLACEQGQAVGREENEQVPIGTEPVSVTRREERGGGYSVTLACGRLSLRGEEELPALAQLLTSELLAMATRMLGYEPTAQTRVLVVGLGNPAMTADAIGPGTLSRIRATRHLRLYEPTLFDALGCCELATFAPGVMAQTGLESGELTAGAVALIRPDLLIAVDALAARSCERLASTLQLSDRGISPGSGIGNHRLALDEATLGCPVMGLGVPTVVDSATLVLDALLAAGFDTGALPSSLMQVLETGRSFIVSPRDSDRVVELTCRLLARAINSAFGMGEL